jgi:hypothetical protein
VNSIIFCEREDAPKASGNLGSKAIDQGYRYALDRFGQREIKRDERRTAGSRRGRAARLPADTGTLKNRMPPRMAGRLRCSLLKLLFLDRRKVDYLSNWVKTR